MLEIVAKRDSLIALLEEERQRWCKSSCLMHISLLQMHVMSIFLFSLTNLSIYPTFSNYQLFYLFIFFSIHIVEILINYCFFFFFFLCQKSFFSSKFFFIMSEIVNSSLYRFFNNVVCVFF